MFFHHQPSAISSDVKLILLCKLGLVACLSTASSNRPLNVRRQKRPPPKQYWYGVLYKPHHVLFQFSPEDGKRTLSDRIEQESIPKDDYPVGRLDYDSEGLLALSNGVRVNKQLLDPIKGHPREYPVQVEGIITDQALRALQKGLIIKSKGQAHVTRPCTAIRFNEELKVGPRDPPIRERRHIPTSWIRLTLTEGKNRQVRRMTASVNFPTLRLIRWRIGKVDGEGMWPGDPRIDSKGSLLCFRTSIAKSDSEANKLKDEGLSPFGELAQNHFDGEDWFSLLMTSSFDNLFLDVCTDQW